MSSPDIVTCYEDNLKTVAEVYRFTLVHLSELKGCLQACHYWHVIVKQYETVSIMMTTK